MIKRTNRPTRLSRTNCMLCRLLLCGATVFLFIAALVPLAFAGQPIHPHTPARDLAGFNHACGTAVDSEGDIYVASADESKIKIFNPSHAEVTFVENTNEPCSLAVTKQGVLFVSEGTTGEVVRYVPNVYPFSGTPAYSSAQPVDTSGDAHGISVDPVDDRLYVADGSRIGVYNSNGTSAAVNEVQRVLVFEATGGFFRLSFKGQQTGSLPWNATHLEVQAALEGLSTIGAGNVFVAGSGGPFGEQDHAVTFSGALTHTDLEIIEGDASELTGPGANLIVQENVTGFSGFIGEGNLTEATGVASYTYRVSNESFGRYIFVADLSADQVKIFGGNALANLELQRTIMGPSEGEQFGFAPAGAYVAVDPGNGDVSTSKCLSVAEQACTAGHFLVYDDAHEAIDEFEANGEFFDQVSKAQLTEADASFADADPTALAIDRSGGAHDGTIYVTSGNGLGAKLLAFGPLAAPSRPPLPAPLSRTMASSRAVAIDAFGNVYVVAGPEIRVFSPSGVELTKFPDTKLAFDIDVDSTGKVYVLDGSNAGPQNVTYYTPSAYPPLSGTSYVKHEPSITSTDEAGIGPQLGAIGINPANDHLLVAGAASFGLLELGSVAEGSPVLNPNLGAGVLAGNKLDVAVYGKNGNIYVSYNPGIIRVIDPSGKGLRAQITGAGSQRGLLSGNPSIAVDQSNGHVLSFDGGRGVAEEYEATGAFVAEFLDPQFGEFQPSPPSYRIAVDNSASSSGKGNVYIAYDEPKPGTPDLWAFGPLSYGEAPLALTGIASKIGGGSSTLNGSVNPRGFDLTECKFEYLLDSQYISNGHTFAGAGTQPCAESLVQIGRGTAAVPVHVSQVGFDPELRYRFRLVAGNKYGASQGDAGLFGPPVLTTQSALPILYDEATLRAEVDPSGLLTEYKFEYGTSEAYDQGTIPVELPVGEEPVSVLSTLTDLAEGTTYHFRIVLKNESMVVEGPDQTFTTGERATIPSCSNAGFRTGLGANLPDCRAYELVTPAETRGSRPFAAPPASAGKTFNDWLVAPRGAEAGQAISYFSDSTLPGFEGNGRLGDGYGARRASDDGLHPRAGWIGQHVGPSYAEAGGAAASPSGVAADQRYSFWEINPIEDLEGGLSKAVYLRAPNLANPKCSSDPSVASHFELVGCGNLGTDLAAESHYLSPGGSHVIFSSRAHLESEAAPVSTEAIYERAAESSLARVVSIKPDGGSFGAGESANYVGATEEGGVVAFRVGDSLYLNDEGHATEVVATPNTFAGISSDGSRVFFSSAPGHAVPASLWFCDVNIGSCAGPEKAHEPSKIADDSIFVNISDDGSHVYFTSEKALTGGEKNESDEVAETSKHNLYEWDGAGTYFISVLDPQDFVGFEGLPRVSLDSWTEAIGAGSNIGRGNSPTRSAPDGGVFVFQSHARLTSYDNEGFSEVYRYSPTATVGEQLICVSCDPTAAPPSADANLQGLETGSSPIGPTTLVSNITDDGKNVFFQSRDRLLPEDANDAQDVYEWKANGAGDCKKSSGCLSLISSGQGEGDSYIFGMSADGHDVFFTTKDKLVSADVPGSPSIYDARVEGGIPDTPPAAPCQGDACQGQGSIPPVLPSPASTGAGGGNLSPQRCPKGKRKVVRKGKARCVARSNKHKKHHKTPNKRPNRQSNENRRAGR